MSRFSKQTAPGSAASADRPLPEPRPDELAPLARAAAAGDPEAAATLVAHVGRSMLTVVRKVLGRENAEVDDVAQDAVMALLGTLASFRGECSVLHFSSRVALLTALSARRRLRLRARWSDDSSPPEELVDGGLSSPLATAQAGRRRELVRDLLDELPDVIAEALALHFVLGYTVDEIAEAAAVSPNTVWSRLRLGKSALRRKLEGNPRLAELLEVLE
jgi:RNA polymerase sigma factor (sigma-70 family)